MILNTVCLKHKYKTAGYLFANIAKDLDNDLMKENKWLKKVN